MYKKRHIDFILHKDEYNTIIFRFRPRQSTCHSFGFSPPTSWDDVYKVYYSYSIINKCNDSNESGILYDCPYDECSVIDEVANRCLLLADGKTSLNVTDPESGKTRTIQLLNNEIHPMGYGTSWDIKHLYDDVYVISMFNWNDIGYRFYLNLDELKSFGDFLNDCCEYMLTHGDPI